MLRHAWIAALSVAVLFSGQTGAAAADIAGPPVYAPPTACGSPVVHSAPLPKRHHKKVDTDYVRIFTVTPYDPGCPAGPPAALYVPPQTAYLASSPTRFTECVWPCRDSTHHDWYDGKLWYHTAGTANRPDVFMILQRD